MGVQRTECLQRGGSGNSLFIQVEAPDLFGRKDLEKLFGFVAGLEPALFCALDVNRQGQIGIG